jgi:ElaB/YqjD/DUF883 family membrane-anchored ribosome-binding protein
MDHNAEKLTSNGSMFDRNKENARAAVAKVREGVGELAEEAKDASVKGVEVAKESFSDSTHAARRAADERLKALGSYVRERPLRGVACALGAGLLLGALLRGRRS